MGKKRHKNKPTGPEAASAKALQNGKRSVLPKPGIAQFCLFGAVLLSSYLLWYSLTKKPMAGCGPGSPCDRVLGSSWAYWLGIPVSALGLAFYLPLLGFGLFLKTEKQIPLRIALCVAILGGASWFGFVQLKILQSICKYCTATHVLASLGSAIILCRMVREQKRRKRHMWPAIAAGVLLFAALPMGQVFAPRASNIIAIHSGTFSFDVKEVPLIGSPDSSKFVVSLFNYTCPDCHDLHHMLIKARATLTNSFSIVTLPLPLASTCNHLIKQTARHHVQDCDYTRLGLAMRRISSDAFEKYDTWFFGQGAIPSLEDSEKKAVEIATITPLRTALKDPWVDKMLQTAVSIYAKNQEATKSLRLPQLIIGNMVNVGPVTDGQLLDLLRNNL